MFRPSSYLFVCLLTASIAAAQTPPSQHDDRHRSPYSVAGIVVDGQDRPVAGATVVLELTNATVPAVRTDARGAFRFTAVSNDAAAVTVTASGFAPLRSTIRTATAGELRLRLAVAPLVESVTVVGERDLARVVDAAYDRNKSVTTLGPETLVNYSPTANYAALRLLPGVMNAGVSGRDRFSLPTHIRGGHAWGIVETIDQYPAVNVTPVSAEDGGYTAGLSTIIPSIAVQSLSVATGGLGVSYGQASGGVVRNHLKRGSAAQPASSVRIEALSLGEGLIMADTGGGGGGVDYYVAGQQSYADYGTAYSTFARPIEGLRLASGLAKVGVRTSPNSRWETMYIGGVERHDYYQDARAAGRLVRHDYHTDKSNHFLASRYDWRPSESLVVGAGLTQNWFRENRIEESTDDIAVNVSRRNRPQRATRLFATVNWRKPLGPAVVYTASGGADVTWDHFEDVTNVPVASRSTRRPSTGAARWRSVMP